MTLRSSVMWHPWRELRALGDEVLLVLTDEVPTGDAWWSPANEVILMRPGLKQVVRRCALAHELGHRWLGHSGQCRYPDSLRQGRRLEQDADQWAARKLITLEALADVVAWTDDRDEAAAELWVTRRMLDVRLDGLYGGERRWVGARLLQRQGEDE